MTRLGRSGIALALLSLLAWATGATDHVDPYSRPAPGPASPANVTTTFKGDWTWRRRPENPPPEFVRRREGGAVVFQLIFSPGERPGVLAVRGKLMLRDGKYLTDLDSTFRLQGVYVEDLGRLAAVTEPLIDVEALNAGSGGNETNKDAVAHSAALRRAAAAVAGLPEGRRAAAHSGGDAALPQRSIDHLENPETTVSKIGPVAPACRFSLEMTFRAATEDGGRAPLPPSRLTALDIGARGALASAACGLELSLSAAPVDEAAYAAKAVRYAAMLTATALAQVALTVRQMDASSTGAAAGRLSLLTLGWSGVMDAFLCLTHLTLGIMVEPLFNAFSGTAFVQFILFGIFELRMLLLTWRARRRGAVDAWTLQRELSSMYARFYGALLAALMLSYNLRRHVRAVALALHAFWVPQIIASAATDSRPPLLPSYVIGMSLTRLVLPLYIFSCPSNLLKVAPSPGTCLALIVLMAVQTGTLLLQSGHRGPQWFVPRRFLPPKYDYFRSAPPRRGKGGGDLEAGDTGDEECVICMNPITEGEGEERCAGTIMTAPCDHRFHRRCLERWMAVKLECPYCRRALPPP